MELDLDQIVKFAERKLAEFELFWREAEEFVTEAVDLNTELFQNTVDDIKAGLADLSEDGLNAGGDPDNIPDVDVEAELREKLDKNY